MAFDIIVVGSTTQDVFVDTKDKLFHPTGKSNCVTVDFGSKILVENLSFAVGGGAHNAAVNFQKLGLQTSVLSVVGDDVVAATMRKSLESHKVDTSLLVQKKGASSYSIILDSFGRERTILAYKGVNDDLLFSDIPLKRFAGVKCIYCATLLGKSFATEQKLMQHMFAQGALTVFNPSQYLASKGISVLRKILRYTNLLIFNREEAYALVGVPLSTKIESVLEKIMFQGPQHIIITDGPRALYATDGNYLYTLCPTKIRVVETTGAGDAFASSFTTAFLRGLPFDVCLCIGLLQSQSIISHFGATNKLLSWEELVHKARVLRKRVKISERE